MDPHDHTEVEDDPIKFREAIDAFLKLVPMTEQEYSNLEESEQDFAFALADVAEADVITQAYDALERAIEEGTDFATFQDDVGQALEDSWGADKPGRLETIFRTGVMNSYNEGRHEQMTSPETAAARPYWRYDGIGGACPICEPCHDTILKATHRWWQTHYPILHPNCRDIVTPMTTAEAEDEGISASPPESPEPVEGFGHPPAGAADSGDEYDPAPEEYPDAIGSILSDKLGDDGE